MNVILIVVLVLVGVVLLLTASWAYLTANRLDRLHVRYDLSWHALDAALARRAVVARAVAVDAYGSGPEGRRLAALAAAAERAARPVREGAENDLSAALEMVDPAALPTALVAELADAEARVLLARRFHNDAVRDTLSLRERPMVRLLHLGGTAALPGYFEIAERAGMPGGPVSRRVSARIALLDEQGRILLFCGSDPAVAGDGSAPRWWFTVGGAAQPGESLAQTAVRELAEETGLGVTAEEMIGPVWRREAVIDFNGSVMRSEEFFFVHRTRAFEPLTTGHSALERSYIHGHRWCDATMVRELVATGEPVYPVQLAELLAEANRLADGSGREPGGRDESQPRPIR
ncbi:NUDIX hydrolase [Mycolicibacterium diernhoferi]|uniref:Exopolyphosphatase n=1 Tax=Mycolicibacterium diernhoferi TaxID=1801 RepID=A0A1Q4HAZ1_9MYCO|nr:NUDIX domain-containing protein [Mycolicibacterium diernhoferi]OJZ64716.1 exopolyphosphatase [Mycolicibacterium diernhoferi]OPE56082.1 exopolyphosphatase [Mycolicibacterium diernhoferi]PEG54924.1 NUDIX domain-containing protein [Mycolicibacterium diernhoferi]QYL25039.1 NUDIX domain-containing protein [Mycolicibacterium diernhoferi]